VIAAQIRAELAQGPLTVAELSERLGIAPAFIRKELWFLSFHDRLVTCDREGRYSLGEPPASLPKLARTI